MKRPAQVYRHMRQFHSAARDRVLTTACTACGAEVGVPCVTDGGMQAGSPHKARVLASKARSYAKECAT